MTYDEQKGTLTIGARTGSFPGMLQQRTFTVIFVGQRHPVPFAAGDKATGASASKPSATGASSTGASSTVVTYDGTPLVVSAKE